MSAQNKDSMTRTWDNFRRILPLDLGTLIISSVTGGVAVCELISRFFGTERPATMVLLAFVSTVAVAVSLLVFFRRGALIVKH